MEDGRKSPKTGVKVLHFADLHLGVENYGRLDPATGLSSRLLDFLATFDEMVDYALAQQVDLVVFAGDAYKSREPSPTQQREFARRLNRLASSGIPVFILVGNHDLPNAVGRATSTEIFDTLAIKNIYVSNRPDVYKIPTRNGDIQIVSLPWVKRSALLSKEETKSLTFEQINQKLEEVLTRVIAANAAKLDPALPSLLAAHVWVAGAKTGSEKSMTIGQEHTLLLSNVANPAFDYVALGHIHKRQVVSTATPPVVYSGSLERLDFGEADDAKGFYVIDIPAGNSPAERKVSYEFHPVEARRFLTLEVTLEAEDPDPTATVLKFIAEHSAEIKDAIVRLQIHLPGEIAGSLRNNDLRQALKEAYFFTIARDIKRDPRFRLGTQSAEELTPLDALKIYLRVNKTSPERANELLEYGEKLIQEHSGKRSG